MARLQGSALADSGRKSSIGPKTGRRTGVNEEKIQNLLQILYLEPIAVGLILLGISVLYFLEGRHMAFFERILKSSHGIFFLCLMYPLVLSNSTAFTDAAWVGYPYWAFLLQEVKRPVLDIASSQ